MMWGCMTFHGVQYACNIDDRMDVTVFTKILEDEFKQSIDYFEMDRKKVMFQQDNNRKHTSKKVIEWFKNHAIHLLDQSVQSPDINPIENLWRYLKLKLNMYDQPPKEMQQHQECVEEQWDAIPQDFRTGLVEIMLKLAAAVLKAKGKYNKY